MNTRKILKYNSAVQFRSAILPHNGVMNTRTILLCNYAVRYASQWCDEYIILHCKKHTIAQGVAHFCMNSNEYIHRLLWQKYQHLIEHAKCEKT